MEMIRPRVYRILPQSHTVNLHRNLIHQLHLILTCAIRFNVLNYRLLFHLIRVSYSIQFVAKVGQTSEQMSTFDKPAIAYKL